MTTFTIIENIDSMYTIIFSNLSCIVIFTTTEKNPPAMQETWVPSLGWEDPLEEAMATHCSILAWRVLLTEEAGELQSIGLQRVRHN